MERTRQEEAASLPGPGMCSALLVPGCLAFLWGTCDAHVQQHLVTVPGAFLASFTGTRASSAVLLCQLPTNCARTLGAVLLLVSRVLWHLGKLPHPAGYSHTLPSEAWVTTVIGEESTYYNVLLTVKLWHSPKDNSASLQMLFLCSLEFFLEFFRVH